MKLETRKCIKVKKEITIRFFIKIQKINKEQLPEVNLMLPIWDEFSSKYACFKTYKFVIGGLALIRVVSM